MSKKKRRFTVTIQQTLIQTYRVSAVDAAEAEDLAVDREPDGGDDTDDSIFIGEDAHVTVLACVESEKVA